MRKNVAFCLRCSRRVKSKFRRLKAALIKSEGIAKVLSFGTDIFFFSVKTFHFLRRISNLSSGCMIDNVLFECFS